MSKISNTSIVNFSDQIASGTDAHSFGLWTSASGGTFLRGAALSPDPAALGSNERYRFNAGDLEISIGGNDALSRRMLRAAVGSSGDGANAALTNGTIYVSLHTASPGTTGANEFGVANYARVQVTNWTVADN